MLILILLFLSRAERKARLIAVYIISSGGLKDDELQKVLSCANLPSHLVTAIKNLSKIGVKLGRIPTSEKPPKKPKPQGQPEYDVSRFKCPLETILSELCESRLSKEAFPVLPSSFPPNCVPSKKAGVSLRAAKPSWQQPQSTPFAPTKQNSLAPVQEFSQGEKIIVYILGGMTYSEVKAIYTSVQKHRRDIHGGSSKIITPNAFLSELTTLQ
jgi:syntaxin-binding protein 1